MITPASLRAPAFAVLLAFAPPAVALAQSAAPPAPAALATATAAAAPAESAASAAPGSQEATLPPDLTVRGMIRHAGRVVQIVMVLLTGASIATWTILLAKTIELMRLLRIIRRGITLAEADAPDLAEAMPRPLLIMREAVRAELAASANTPVEGTKDRLASRLHRLEMRLVRHVQRGTGVLATIGATSPFLGLFGTVWGIMNSFVGIARLHTTNLAVVAPGIAEALLATAAGLIVAIPAVIIYNLLVRWIASCRHELGDLGEVVLRHTARALDKTQSPRGSGRLAAE